MPNSVLHYGPMLALGIIVLVFSATWRSYKIVFPSPSFIGLSLLLSWLFSVLALLVGFFGSIYLGGGVLKKKWRPENPEDEKFLQFCKICDGFKAPRSHHCQTCNGCVMKMDHHCPWVNSCVGNRNQFYFVLFVLFVPIGLVQSLFIMGLYFLKVWEYMFTGYGFESNLKLKRQIENEEFWFLYTIFAAVMALGVALAVSFLLAHQLEIIFKNMTGIEMWIVEKAAMRQRKEPFVYPYNLGLWNNVKEFIRASFHGDGIKWQVLPGCNEYSLTKEQLEQKALKRAATTTHKIVHPSGRCACSFGCKVCCCGPLPDENRISVKEGEIVQVWKETKWGWVYGEKVALEGGKAIPLHPRARGWFPLGALSEEIFPSTLSATMSTSSQIEAE